MDDVHFSEEDAKCSSDPEYLMPQCHHPFFSERGRFYPILSGKRSFKKGIKLKSTMRRRLAKAA